MSLASFVLPISLPGQVVGGEPIVTRPRIVGAEVGFEVGFLVGFVVGDTVTAVNTAFAHPPPQQLPFTAIDGVVQYDPQSESGS